MSNSFICYTVTRIRAFPPLPRPAWGGGGSVRRPVYGTEQLSYSWAVGTLVETKWRSSCVVGDVQIAFVLIC
jgi:hypothetical protein